jgi:NADPH-dependent curcumin reductase
MNKQEYRRIVLARRPTGIPELSDFGIETVPIPEPRYGEVLVRTIYLSLDPYELGPLRGPTPIAREVPIGGVPIGGAVGEVVASNHPDFTVGDIVEDQLGWQEYAIGPASRMRKIDPGLGPIATANGILGMTGMTAYFGLFEVGEAKPGETVVVSAASGAVGQVVGQLARVGGCRVVGIAGGPQKCAFVRDELGFDACLDYKAEPDLTAAVKAACPSGVDVYFDNVGGPVSDAVIPCLNLRARIALCGSVSRHHGPASNGNTGGPTHHCARLYCVGLLRPMASRPAALGRFHSGRPAHVSKRHFRGHRERATCLHRHVAWRQFRQDAGAAWRGAKARLAGPPA